MNCMRNSCCGFCRLQSLRRYPNLSPLRPPCCTAADSPWVAIPTAVLLFLVTCDREKVPCTDRVHWVPSPLCRSLIGDTIFERIKEKRGHAFLGPSDQDTVRVRLIASAIFRAAQDLFSRDGDRDDKQEKTAAALYDLKWELIIFDNEKAKAYSLPNGKIVVYTGLLNCLNTDAEIAALIAHEAGHVVANHNTEFSRMIPFHDKLASQRNEMEADLIGLKLLAAAGFDTDQAHGVYEKSREIRRGSWSRFHPWRKKE